MKLDDWNTERTSFSSTAPSQVPNPLFILAQGYTNTEMEGAAGACPSLSKNMRCARWPTQNGSSPWCETLNPFIIALLCFDYILLQKAWTNILASSPRIWMMCTGEERSALKICILHIKQSMPLYNVIFEGVIEWNMTNNVYKTERGAEAKTTKHRIARLWVLSKNWILM